MTPPSLPVLVAGGGIGGMAAALTLARRGMHVKVLEQASQLGEIGAGIQLGPNAFAAFDALGLGEHIRSLAICTEEMLMYDALSEAPIGRIPTGAAFRQRFGNPYAVIHRADMHQALVAAVHATERVEVLTSTAVQQIEQDDASVTVHDARGHLHRGAALVAADGVRSVVRKHYVGDAARVSGDVIYRTVVDRRDFPVNLQANAASIWVGPGCNLVHYPLRGTEQYNVVITFQSGQAEEWGVTEGSADEVHRFFDGLGICPRAYQLVEALRTWRRWATADKDPIAQWTFGPGRRVTLLGDAAHPTLQYMAQGACMALEDAVTLGEAMQVHGNDFAQTFDLYQRSRVTRTARIVLSSREFRRFCSAKGVERLVRNEMWRGRTPEKFYDALEWLYGWNARDCLSA